jgi:hypothetical protein
MSQVKWSDGDNLVTTGWDSLTHRFHLTVEDAPTGEVLYDCMFQHPEQTATWVNYQLDQMHIERPVWLGGELTLQRDVDARNLVVRYHHTAEHDLLGEPQCSRWQPVSYPVEGNYTKDVDVLDWYRA